MIKKNLNSLEEVKPELRALKEEGYQVYPKDAIYFNQFGIIATKDNEESVWLCWSVGTEEFLLIENKPITWINFILSLRDMRVIAYIAGIMFKKIKLA